MAYVRVISRIGLNKPLMTNMINGLYYVKFEPSNNIEYYNLNKSTTINILDTELELIKLVTNLLKLENYTVSLGEQIKYPVYIIDKTIIVNHKDYITFNKD